MASTCAPGSATSYWPQPKCWGLLVYKAVAAHIYLDKSGDLGWQLEKCIIRADQAHTSSLLPSLSSRQKDHLPEHRLRQGRG
jgi:hypothetical protein